jgi:hypothetical protein
MDEVRLYFTTGRTLRLFRIECFSGTTRHVAVASRSGVARGDAGVFRWTRGVRGVSILFVQTALARHDPRVAPRIEGGRGSIAASLDGALSQEAAWLDEMFGLSQQRILQYRRIFLRTNPGLKRCGPVAVSCAPRVRSENIRIFLDGAPVVEKTLLEGIFQQLIGQVS